MQRQSYRPLETIVVDNASTDGTRELLSKFGAAVKVFYNDTNSGFAAAQNQAARSAQGSWLLCCVAASLSPLRRTEFLTSVQSIR